MGQCYVYIIRSGQDKQGPIKIGVANNPEARLAELQVGNPFKLKLMTAFVMEDKHKAMRFEQFMHRELKRFRMSGEWFDNRRMGREFHHALQKWQSCTQTTLEKSSEYKRANHEREIKRLKKVIAEQDAYIEELHDQIALLESPI